MSGTTAVYDAFTRLVEVQATSGNTQLLYAPDGYKFAYMTGQSVHRYIAPLAAGVQAVYTGATPAAPAYWRHSDWLGTVRMASTPTQTVFGDQAYGPFGESYASSGTGLTDFTGQNKDLTSSIYDFTFRQYSQIQGRWMVPDPAGLAAVDITNPQTWNCYAYVANNPLSNVDPLGLHPCGSTGDFCDGPDNGAGECCGGFGGPCGAWCAPPGIIQNVPTLTNAYQQSMGVYLSCLGYNFNCDANGNYQAQGSYVWTGGNGSNLDKQTELAASQFGQAACAGQDGSSVATCIQQVYNQLSTQNPTPNGGNYDFQYASYDPATDGWTMLIQINGQSIDPSDFSGCMFGRCGLFNSMDFSHGDGTFHVDTANVWFFPVGTFVHVFADVLAGNTWWWQGGIPRFP